MKLQRNVTMYEPDWDGQADAYANLDENPNMLAWLTQECWVASSADIVRAITLLANVLQAREALYTER